MKVENISVRAYSEKILDEQRPKEEKEKKNKNVINANELNLTLGMSTSEKRIAKEREALKVKLEQMLSDEEYSNGMKEHLARKTELQQESINNRKEIKSIEEVKQTVKEAYGIEDDSEEQKQLEEIEALREKQKAGENLTAEEMERLGSREDLTDYQKLMLEYDDAIDEFEKRAEKSEQNAQMHGAAVDAMKQALLKVHPMVDASKQANEMILSALKEEQNTLLEEMKENYDEKAEEEKEKAEEAKEEREELQEIKEAEPEKKQMENLLEVSADIDMQEEVLKKKLLLEEDLKGIEVDETV